MDRGRLLWSCDPRGAARSRWRRRSDRRAPASRDCLATRGIVRSAARRTIAWRRGRRRHCLSGVWQQQREARQQAARDQRAHFCSGQIVSGDFASTGYVRGRAIGEEQVDDRPASGALLSRRHRHRSDQLSRSDRAESDSTAEKSRLGDNEESGNQRRIIAPQTRPTVGALAR